MKNLKKAYKRLNKEMYSKLAKDTLIPLFDDYDSEFTVMITPDTKFKIEKHYYDGLFMGYNIYANGELLETKSTREKAKKYLRKVLEGSR